MSLENLTQIKEIIATLNLESETIEVIFPQIINFLYFQEILKAVVVGGLVGISIFVLMKLVKSSIKKW